MYFLHDMKQEMCGNTEFPALWINYLNMLYHKDSVKTAVLSEELNHLCQIFFIIIFLKGEKQ